MEDSIRTIEENRMRNFSSNDPLGFISKQFLLKNSKRERAKKKKSKKIYKNKREERWQ